MKMRNIIRLVSSLTILSTVFACHHQEKDVNAGSEEAPQVDVALPEIQPVTLTKSYPGYLEAADEVDLVARVSGKLLSAPYIPGHVRKGAVLFEIEKTRYVDAVNRAKASLESAKATRDYAASRLEALQKALASDAVSKMEVEQAQSTLREAVADVQSFQAALEDAQTQLDYCTIRAPFSGNVSTRKFDPGTILNANEAPVLATIFNDSSFKVRFNIEDAQYIKMIDSGKANLTKNGDELPLKFSEQLPHEYKAKLSYVSPNVDTGTGTYTLEGHLDNPYGELKSGMYVVVDLPYEKLDSAIVIRAAAVNTDQRGDYIYTLNDSNVVQQTRITAGQTIHDSLQVVTSGLKPGTRYVTKALLKVRPGEKVNPSIAAK